jgi:hypothetical protein
MPQSSARWRPCLKKAIHETKAFIGCAISNDVNDLVAGRNTPQNKVLCPESGRIYDE